MDQTTSSSSVLLLERPGDRTEPVLVDLDVVLNSKRPKRESTWATGSDQYRDTDPALQSPGLALFAAVALLEGYKRLDLIPAGTGHTSALLFGRGGAVVFAVAAALAGILATRTAGGAVRVVTRNLMIVGTLGVVAATALLLATNTSWSSNMAGGADLVLAASAAGALIIGEHRKRSQEDVGTIPSRLPTAERARRAA